MTEYDKKARTHALLQGSEQEGVRALWEGGGVLHQRFLKGGQKRNIFFCINWKDVCAQWKV